MATNNPTKHTCTSLHQANDNEVETLPPHSHSSDIQSCKSTVQYEEKCSSLSMPLKPLAAALGRQAAREWIKAHSTANDNSSDPATSQSDDHHSSTEINPSSPSEDTN